MTPAPLGERVRALEIRADDHGEECTRANIRISELRAEMFKELAKVHVNLADHGGEIRKQALFQNWLTGAAAGIAFIFGAMAAAWGVAKDYIHLK